MLPLTQYRLWIQPAPTFPASVHRLKEAVKEQKSFHLLDGFPQLPGVFSEQTDRSILVLYITAHGVSHGGRAYLLADDFEVAQSESGRLELAQLFEQLRKCPAKMKLLILEAGYAVTDPRLGMLVNEFPRLLESELEAVDDPNLWVLTASQSLETSHVSYSLGQSVFSHFVTEGLKGVTDDKGNTPDIELKGFFTFVRDGVSQWVKRHSQGSQTQTPSLIHAGEGRDDDPPDGLFLLHVPRKKPPEPDESESDADAEADTDEKQEPVDEDGETKSEDKPSEDPETNPLGTGRPAAVKDKDSAVEAKDASAEDGSQPETTADAVPSDQEKTPATEKKPTPESSDAPPDESPDKEPPTPPETQEAPTSNTSDDPPNDLPDNSVALDAVRRLLDAAWHWRDELQSRRTDGWSPVDYAPHLWHEYQELILVHESRWRYQMPLDRVQLDTLKRLAAGRLPTSGSGEGATFVLDRLADARREFLRGQAKADFDLWSTQLPGVEQAVKLRNDLLFEIPYYLRWHARAALVSPDTPPFQTIRRLVDELGLLGSLLESMEPGDETPQSPPPNPRAKLKQLDELVKTLQDLREELISRELIAQSRSLLEDTVDEKPITKMECLLSTPLLEADARIALLDALENMANPAEDTLDIAASTIDAAEWYEGRRSRWAALASQAELEVAVIQKLADPNFRTTSDPADLSNGGSREAEEKLWTAYRQLGLELAEFYHGLPQQVNRALSLDDSQTVRRAAVSLTLVDPREVRARIEKGAGRLTLRPLAWQTVVLPRPTVEGPETVALEPGDWSKLPLQIHVAGRPVAKISMLLDFDPTQLSIESYDGRTTYRPQSPQEVDLGPDAKETLDLRVRPVDDVKKFTPLSIRINAEDEEALRKVSFLIPPPDRVDLVVERLLDATGRRVQCSSGDVGVVSCPVFPNRPAEYRLSLKNLSGKPRTVAVRFWSVPQRNPEEKATRSGPLNDIGRPLPGFSPLADPVEIELPAEDQFVPLAFPAPEDAEKEKAEGGAPDADAPAEEPAAPEGESPDNGTSITHGIVCQIVDAEGGPPWIQWIDFDWTTPYEYIQPSVSYSLSQRKVSIELRLRDDQRVIPGMLSEMPVSILWENADDLPEDTSPSFKASIKSARGVARLSAENIDPDTRELQIRLAVDGYPRALMFKPFDCDSDHQRIDVDDNMRHAKIGQPRQKEAYRLTDTGLEPTMSVIFKVDAPYDALQRVNDFVRVGIDTDCNRQFDEHEQEGTLTFWTDRQRTAVLEELTPEGTLKLVAKVDDFTVQLSPEGPANKEVFVLAQLFIAGRKSTDDYVPVILDRGEPEISLQPFPKTIPPGSKLTVPARVTDVSGVESVEFGFDVNLNEKLDDDEKPLKVFAADADGIWKAALETKDLTPGTPYKLIVRATDRVGHSAKLTERIAVGTVPEEPMPQKPKTVTLQGRAYLGSSAGDTRWSKLSISGVPGTAKIDKNTGDFTFADVPPGDYTLTAKGSSGNRSKQGSATVTITGDEPTASIDIPMD